MTESARISLRHSLMFLRCIVGKATLLYPGKTLENRIALGVLRDYFTWLAVDAMTDEGLAKSLVHILAKLQEELHAKAKTHNALSTDPIASAFHEGFLYGLEQAISFNHGVDLLLDEELNRRDYLESWERTRERLGL